MLSFRSVYGRLVFSFCIVVLFAFAVLAFATPRVIRNNSIENEKDALTSKAKVIAEVYLETYASGDTGAGMQTNIERLADYDDIHIRIADRFKSTVWESGDTNISDNVKADADALMDDVLSGAERYSVTYNDDSTATPVVTVGVPIRSDGAWIGCVICNSTVDNVDALMSNYYGQLVISGCFTILIAVILAMFTSRRLEKPLEEVATAADSISKGDFQKRIDVDKMHEMRGLANTFNTMAEELEKYENTRSSFVANVSHELRSPLTSIQGFVQGILDGTIEDENDKKQYLGIVLDETRRLNVLISDLLDLSKLESGQFPLHKTDWDINELIRQSLIRFITKIEDKNLEITVDIPDEKTMISADKDRLTQVVTNIIDNAVKYSNENGFLKIWTTVKNDDGKVEISIANSGDAIPEEDLPYVFDRFFKVDKSHNRKIKGTGIGLSIVWNIIVQHGEKIWVNSKEGTGTVFTFTMPLAKQEEPEEKKPEKSGRDFRRKKISKI